jgi:hypothetical protein
MSVISSFIPGLQTRLFSIESFISNRNYRVIYEKWGVTLELRRDPLLTVTIQLPHVPPGTYAVNEINHIVTDNPYVGLDTRINRNAVSNWDFQEIAHEGEETINGHHINMAQVVNNNNIEKEKNMTDDPQAEGGQGSPPFNPINWDNFKNKKGPHQMNVELGHVIFGHRAVSSLLAASRANVWDDIKMILSRDSWCDMCRVAIAPKNKLSKIPMKINEKPLEMIFLDEIPSPGTLQCIPECSNKQFLFLIDPVSKYVEMLPAKDYSSKVTIHLLSDSWSRMVKKRISDVFYDTSRCRK